MLPLLRELVLLAPELLLLVLVPLVLVPLVLVPLVLVQDQRDLILDYQIHQVGHRRQQKRPIQKFFSLLIHMWLWRMKLNL
jgi:hypothetical protein